MPQFTDKWGKAEATKRYGSPSEKIGKPAASAQANQFPEDKHGAKYDNDTPNNWLRGKGMKPGYDKANK